MARLLERRLQQLRGSSYVLTLPKDWVEETGLKKGSGVTMVVEQGLIRVVPSELSFQRVLEVELEEGVGRVELEALVRGCYLAGLDGLRVRFPRPVDQQLRNSLRKFRSELAGTVVTVEDERTVSLEFYQPGVHGYSHALRLFSQSVSRFFSSFLEGASVEELEGELEEVMTYAYLMSRRASQSLVKPSEDVDVAVASRLVAFSETCLMLVKRISELDWKALKIDEVTLEASTLMKRMFSELHRIYAERDVSAAVRMAGEVEEVRKSLSSKVAAEIESILFSAGHVFNSLASAMLLTYYASGL